MSAVAAAEASPVDVDVDVARAAGDTPMVLRLALGLPSVVASDETGLVDVAETARVEVRDAAAGDVPDSVAARAALLALGLDALEDCDCVGSPLGDGACAALVEVMTPGAVDEGDKEAVQVVVVAPPLPLAVWVRLELGVADAVRACDPVALLVGASDGVAEKLLPGESACDGVTPWLVVAVQLPVCVVDSVTLWLGEGGWEVESDGVCDAVADACWLAATLLLWFCIGSWELLDEAT